MSPLGTGNTGDAGVALGVQIQLQRAGPKNEWAIVKDTPPPD